MSISDLLRYVKDPLRRLWYELKLHKQRFLSPKIRPCLIVFPNNQPWESSANLRAWKVAKELEKLGWRVIVVPQPLSLSQRQRIVRLEKPNVILMQQFLHPLNRPQLYSPIPCVIDTDGAEFLDPRWSSVIFDSAHRAQALVCGSNFVADSLRPHNPSTHVIWTGSPEAARPPKTRPASREPIVAWAHATPLKYPIEAALMQSVMVEVSRRVRCTFWLFGTDEDQAGTWLAPIRAAGGQCVAISPLPYEAYLEKVSEAAVGLMPVCTEHDFSRGKSFGKVLAYLAGQTAVVATDAVDHPLFFHSRQNGFLVNNSVAEWTDAIVELLSDLPLRQAVGEAGWNDFNRRLTTKVFAEMLDPILREAELASHKTRLPRAEPETK